MYLFALTLGIILATLAGSALPQDLTIKTRSSTTGGVIHTEILRIHGNRMRSDSKYQPGGSGPVHYSSIIEQCDLGRAIMLDDNAQTYSIIPRKSEAELRAEQEKLKADMASGRIKPLALDPKAGTVTTRFEVKDTGEQKEISGVKLRHVKEVLVQEVTPGSPIDVTPRTERDVWYADVPEGCHKRPSGRIAFTFTFGIPAGFGQPRTEMKATGDLQASRGKALMGTVVTRMPNGTKSVERMELLEISRAPLDPGLFEIPEGYRPALHLPNGGVDMARPDTLLNRISAWWHRLWTPRPKLPRIAAH